LPKRARSDLRMIATPRPVNPGLFAEVALSDVVPASGYTVPAEARAPFCPRSQRSLMVGDQPSIGGRDERPA
jgi:hypothetical protein